MNDLVFFLANAASTNGDAPLIRIHRMWVIDVNVDAGCVLGVFALFSIKRLAFLRGCIGCGKLYKIFLGMQM